MKRTIAIFLSSLVLLSNMGLTFATHYCSGFAVKSQVMLGHHALDCGMAGMDAECESTPSEMELLVSKSCCDNQYQTLDTDDEYTSGHVLELPSPEFLVAFLEVFVYNFFQTNIEQSNLAHYKPPLLEFNLPVLNQVFLL